MVTMATPERLFFVVMRLLCCSFLEDCMNSAKEVRRSLHPSLHFPANFYNTPSPSFISPHLIATSCILSTFHITLVPSIPFPPSSVCPGILLSLSFSSPYLSTSPSSFTFSPAMPSISFSPSCASLLVSASFSLALPFYVSIASSRLLARHMNCCAVNNSGVTLGDVTGLSMSW